MTSFVTPKTKFHNCPKLKPCHVHTYMYICRFTPAAPVLFSCKFISICGGKKKHFSYLHIRSVAHVSFVYALDKYSISSFQQKTTHAHKHTYTQMHNIYVVQRDKLTRIRPNTFISILYDFLPDFYFPPSSHMFFQSFYIESVCLCVCVHMYWQWCLAFYVCNIHAKLICKCCIRFD